MISILTIFAALVSGGLLSPPQTPMPRLSVTEYFVGDTTKYESFRLKLFNDSDSLVYIEEATPSCGCVLVTVQRALATRDRPGDIYIAVTTDKMSVDQPITVDVVTNVSKGVPLRLYLRKRPPSTSSNATGQPLTTPLVAADTLRAPEHHPAPTTAPRGKRSTKKPR